MAYNLIIAASIIIILSFMFGEISRKTNVPSVLMLIALGIGLKFGMDNIEGLGDLDFFPVLEILGIVGLIMIVLEAALELELKKEKLVPILKALLIALVGLMASAWAAAAILQYFLPDMTTIQAWLYATPLSILSSAIIIPSVSGLNNKKKEFHIYESTFSDILGIMLFYFLAGQVEHTEHSNGIAGFFGNLGLTIALALISSYGLVLIFQNIRSHVKLFLLISVLLLLYALGKKMHLSSLIIILIFGLLIGNVKLFFQGRLGKWVDLDKARHIYENLHIITMETAFVVRTFFFVIFGLTISLATLLSYDVLVISMLILASIYAIRYLSLLLLWGPDLIPQVFIAPRGLITVLLFYAIPHEAYFEGFNPGILLFIIIATSIIMTFAMVNDKRKAGKAQQKAKALPVGYVKWQAPSIEDQESKH